MTAIQYHSSVLPNRLPNECDMKQFKDESKMQKSTPMNSINPRQSIEHFCRETSLHGWKYCIDKGLLHSLFWLTILIVSIGSLIYLMTVNINEFLDATVSFNLVSATASLGDVFFPSVVVCNMNTLSKSFIKTIQEDPDLK